MAHNFVVYSYGMILAARVKSLNASNSVIKKLTAHIDCEE